MNWPSRKIGFFNEIWDLINKNDSYEYMISNVRDFNGYRILGNYNLYNPKIQKTIDFLTRMDICVNCVDSREYDLKIGDFQYRVNHGERTITIN